MAVFVRVVTQTSFGPVGAKPRFGWLSLPNAGVRKSKDTSAGFTNLTYFADFF